MTQKPSSTVQESQALAGLDSDSMAMALESNVTPSSFRWSESGIISPAKVVGKSVRFRALHKIRRWLLVGSNWIRHCWPHAARLLRVVCNDAAFSWRLMVHRFPRKPTLTSDTTIGGIDLFRRLYYQTCSQNTIEESN